MRKLLDDISVEGTVVLVFGRTRIMHPNWEPIFADGFNNSKVKWKVDSNIFTVHRARRRDKHTNNFRALHSRTEHILIFTRKALVAHKKNGLEPVTLRYTTEFRAKYGEDNGTPTNIFLDYQPPSHRGRLRDADGKDFRRNAEKTMLICEYFVDLFTDKNGVVVDLYAGTASMGMACIKLGRKYFGCEIEEPVWRAAVHRLARTWIARERGDFEPMIAGIPRSLNEQVPT
jgi:hypothetical protein